ncbi:unnamed protein product [Spirodela intermedia]|uniref:Endonuclease/exonuclease/phosphatase domain-containing protein n=1 Tax=Spirodela intermedia TaxID=51605 RepID=A0A7I8IL81_SPIIN|nr:unnamed protein product [Spirodela intermedia]CAA6658655.1 unnamed protein product [Spirodela intermedia]
MRSEGYAGTFKRRTGGSTDGCAIFWRENEFHLLEEKSIEFKSFHLRDNIAQLCIFEIRILLQNAHALAQKRGGIPVVLAGDFNSTPQSAVYEFLSTSELNLAAHDRKYLSGQNKHHPLSVTSTRCMDYPWTNEELRTATGHWGCAQLEHSLKLQSAYASVKGASTTRGPKGEPLATTYHSKFLGTVDYVWYSSGLSPLRVLDTLSLSDLRKIDGLPWEGIGSDHLALACDFVFTEKHTELAQTAPGK